MILIPWIPPFEQKIYLHKNVNVLLIWKSTMYNIEKVFKGGEMRKFHYSWVILAVTFIAIIVAGIIRSSSGIFLDPFESEFGWEDLRFPLHLQFAYFYMASRDRLWQHLLRCLD